MGDRLHVLVSIALLACPGSSACASSGGSGATAPVLVASTLGQARAALFLPPVPVKTLDGTSTELRKLLGGRPAVVSLWATWCEACNLEIDALKRLQARTTDAAGHDVDGVIVGIAVGESRETVAAFAARRRLTYAQLVDEDYRLADALGERRVPATLVVDRAGRIVYRGASLDAEALAHFNDLVNRTISMTSQSRPE